MFELLWKGVKEMEKLAYNMKEVAEVLGISKSLAYEMAKKRRTPDHSNGKQNFSSNQKAGRNV